MSSRDLSRDLDERYNNDNPGRDRISFRMSNSSDRPGYYPASTYRPNYDRDPLIRPPPKPRSLSRGSETTTPVRSAFPGSNVWIHPDRRSNLPLDRNADSSDHPNSSYNGHNQQAAMESAPVSASSRNSEPMDIDNSSNPVNDTTHASVFNTEDRQGSMKTKPPSDDDRLIEEGSVNEVPLSDPRLNGSSASKLGSILLKWADNEITLGHAKAQRQEIDQHLTKRQHDFELVHKNSALEKALREDTVYKDHTRRRKQHQEDADRSTRYRNLLATSLEGQIIEIARNEAVADSKKANRMKEKQAADLATRLDKLENKCNLLEEENQNLRVEIDSIKRRNDDNDPGEEPTEKMAKAVEAIETLLVHLKADLKSTEERVDGRIDSMKEAIENVKAEAEASMQSSVSELQNGLTEREAALEAKIRDINGVLDSSPMKSSSKVLPEDDKPEDITESLMDRTNTEKFDAVSTDDISDSVRKNESPDLLKSIKEEVNAQDAKIESNTKAIDRLAASVRCQNQQLSETSIANAHTAQHIGRDMQTLYQKITSLEQTRALPSHWTAEVPQDRRPSSNSHFPHGSHPAGGQPFTAGASTSPIGSPPMPSPILQPGRVIMTPTQTGQGWHNPAANNTYTDHPSLQSLEKMVRVHEHRLNNFTIGRFQEAVLHHITETYRYPETVARDLEKFKAVAERVNQIERVLNDVKSNQKHSAHSQDIAENPTGEPTMGHEMQHLATEFQHLWNFVELQFKALPPNASTYPFETKLKELKASFLSLDSMAQDLSSTQYRRKKEIMKTLEHLRANVISAHLGYLTECLGVINQKENTESTPASETTERLGKIEAQLAHFGKYDHLLVHNELNMLKARLESLDKRPEGLGTLKRDLDLQKKWLEKLERQRKSVPDNAPSPVMDEPPDHSADTSAKVTAYVEEQMEQFGTSLLRNKQAYDKRLASLEEKLAPEKILKLERDVTDGTVKFEYAFNKITEFVGEFSEIRGDLNSEHDKIVQLEQRIGKISRTQPMERVQSTSTRASDGSHTFDSERRDFKRKKRVRESDSE